MLPREITTENWPDRATYDLPVRPIGKLRWLGLPLIGFAMVFAWSPGQEVWSLIRHLLEGRAEAGHWFMGGFTFLFVLAALVPFGMGMFILIGRTRIVVNPKWIRITECAGPFRWSRRVRCDSVVGLEVGHAKPLAESVERRPAELSTLPGGLLSLGALVAKKRFGKPALLVIGYPQDWIEPLANELSEFLRSNGHKVPVREVEVSIGSSGIAPSAEIIEKPLGTDIQMTETPGRVEIHVPSRGFFKQSYGLFLWGLIWSLLTMGLGFAFVHQRGPGTETLLFFGLSLCLGLAMTLFGMHLGTARWTLKADSLGLEVTRRSALRMRTWTWRRPEIDHIQAGPSGVEVNGRPLDELQIHPVHGKKKGMMIGRSREGLGWMAFSLGKVLKIQSADEQTLQRAT